MRHLERQETPSFPIFNLISVKISPQFDNIVFLVPEGLRGFFFLRRVMSSFRWGGGQIVQLVVVHPKSGRGEDLSGGNMQLWEIRGKI